jgi:hypothetical protein
MQTNVRKDKDDVPLDLDLIAHIGSYFIENLFNYLESSEMKTLIFTLDMREEFEDFLASESMVITYDALLNAQHNNSFKDSVQSFLKECNISNMQHGYAYLQQSLRVVQELNRTDFAITKDIYPVIARENNTTTSCVESSIRSSLQTAWKKSISKEGSGLALYFDKCPTNSEYISYLCKQFGIFKT